MKDAAPSPSALRNYGLLALPLAVAGLPLYLHVPDFYVTGKGLSLSSVGIVLLLARIFDAIQDPLIGVLGDRYSQWRRPAMAAALAGLGAGMLALLVPPAGAGIGWFATWVIVATSCYSVATINLNALGGIWSRDTHERTRIASTRERFGLLGVCFGVLLPGMLSAGLGQDAGFAVFSGMLLLVLAYCGWRFRQWSSRHAELMDQGGYRGGGFNLAFPGDARVRRLVVVSFAGALGSAFPAVLFLFFVRDRLEGESWSWVFLLIYFAAAIAGVPLWRDLSRKFGKVRTWCLSMVLAVGAFAGAGWTGTGDFVLYGLVCLVTGLALGGDLVFPASIMADLVGSSESGRSRATTGYAWLSFVQKAGLGIAAGISLPLLGLLGYQSGGDNGTLAISGLVAFYAVVPLLLKTGGGLLLWSWRDHLGEELSYDKKTNNNRNRPTVYEFDSDRMQKPYEN